MGTTILQLTEIPPRPEQFDGAVALFQLTDETDEKSIRVAFDSYVVRKVEFHTFPEAIVWLGTHESAVKAVEAGVPTTLCAGCCTLYNDRPYGDRGWVRSLP